MPRTRAFCLALTLMLPGIAAIPAGSQSTPARTTPVGRAATVSPAQRTLDLTHFIAQRMTALAQLSPRTYTPPKAVVAAPVRADVRVAGRVGTGVSRSVDYCASHPPEIDRVTGNVTPNGVLTITGDCFGSSGSALLTGTFPFEPNGVTLLVESWSETAVTARLFGKAHGGYADVTTNSFTGSLDQPVELRLVTHRSAGRLTVVGPGLVSEPVRLNYTAARVARMAGISTLECAAGEPLDPQRPDACAQSGWGTYVCDAGHCLQTYHARKSAASGEDVYSVKLGRGFVLERVMLFGDGAEVVFDESIDASHVTFRVRWRTAHASDAGMVKRGYPEYADYNDGSYMLYPLVTGPQGVLN